MDSLESKELLLFKTHSGKVPYRIWFDSLRDRTTRGRIDVRIARLRMGQFGKCKSVGDGVSELILDFGPGYRIYFGQAGAAVVLLLCGGEKDTQKADIEAAKAYWAEYCANPNKENTYVQAY